MGWERRYEAARKGLDADSDDRTRREAKDRARRRVPGRVTQVELAYAAPAAPDALVTIARDASAASKRPVSEQCLTTALLEVLDQVGDKRDVQNMLTAAARSVEALAGVSLPAAASEPATGGQALWQVAERRASMLYRQAAHAGVSDVHDPAVEAALRCRGSGSPLPAELRADMELSLGVSLAGVRIHTDSVASLAAQAIDANAFTVGEDVYFAAGCFAPGSQAGRKLIAHELTHVAQALRGATAAAGELQVSHPGDASEREAEAFADRVDDRPAPTSGEAASGQATSGDDASGPATPDHAATSAATPVASLVGRAHAFAILRDPAGKPPGQLSHAQPIDVISLSETEYEALTGQPAAAVPESKLPEPRSSSAASGAVVGVGVGSTVQPPTSWYYRVLSSTDPRVADILAGAGLKPVSPSPGHTFQPAQSPAEMTYRHIRPCGNVPRTGTDRISSASNLESIERLLADRGTGELVRIDVQAARRLGAQFLEHGDIMRHLDEIGRVFAQQLASARAAVRGKNFIAKIESRLESLARAKEYALSFGEGHGVNGVPSDAISSVKGATLQQSVAVEKTLLSRLRAFRVAGRVVLVVGVGMSIAHVASAAEGQRARTAAEETGGWALSFGGAHTGAKLGAGVGAALGWETGPGAVIATLLGAAIGGVIGVFAGQKAVSATADKFDLEAMVHEALTADYRKFKELNPDAPPSDYDRLQQTQDNFDTWGPP